LWIQVTINNMSIMSIMNISRFKRQSLSDAAKMSSKEMN